MFRKLFWILTILGLATLVQRMVRQAAPRTAAGPATPRFEGAMVRDRVCGTFVPRSSALVLHKGGGEHFFCSEACRRAFLEAPKLPRG